MAVSAPVVVLGGTGLAGRALVAELVRRGRPTRAPARAEVDLLHADAASSAVAELRPSLVILAAAFTDVAAAERPEQAGAVWALNRDAPRAIAMACRELGVPLVHVSTDYVFDGLKEAPYVEDDPTHPLQVYGRSKLAGEEAVRHELPDALIVRTSTLYGHGRTGRPHYVDAILGQAERPGTIEVVRLPVASPTYATHLAPAILDLAEVGATGVVHAVNDGATSRLDLARATVRLSGRPGVTVVERSAPPGGPARPPMSALDTTLLARRIGRRLPPWEAGLADYLASRTS